MGGLDGPVGVAHPPSGCRRVSWRILLDDLNTAWAQRCAGQAVVLPVSGTSFARWSVLLAEYAHHPDVVAQAEVWRQVAAASPVLPAVRPEVDTFATAGRLSQELDVETTRMLLGEVPARFTPECTRSW
ncbi:condensation domain protein [Mycobacterium xenopi 3993]|nr:condensation domain protein [Mycobacterium xenopi 3993]